MHHATFGVDTVSGGRRFSPTNAIRRLKSFRVRDIVASHMLARRALPRFVPWLLAVAFLAIQAIAVAHEIKHDLHQHNSACSLHFYAEHLGKGPTSSIVVAPQAVHDDVPTSFDSVDIRAPRAFGYRTRGPPRSF